MHRIVPSYRRIAIADLPRVRANLETEELRAATPQELTDRGIVHVRDDIYSCIEQHIGDVVYDAAQQRDVRVFRPLDGEIKPGEILSAGDLRERHARLPADIKKKILRADVIRSTDPAVKVLEVVEANLLEQATVIDSAVGDVVAADGSTAPLVDFENPDTTLDEARRLVELPNSGIERARVPMEEIADGSDVVEAANLIPHMWAGERA